MRRVSCAGAAAAGQLRAGHNTILILLFVWAMAELATGVPIMQLWLAVRAPPPAAKGAAQWCVRVRARTRMPAMCGR